MPFQTLAAPRKAFPRSQPEAIIKYSLLPSVLMGEVVVTEADACEFEEGNEVIPALNPNYYLFAVVKEVVGAAQIVLTVTGTDYGSGPKSGTITISAAAGFDKGFLCTGGDGWATISSITCAGGTANDFVDIWAVPDPDQFTLWRYLRSYDISPSHGRIPVPDRFRSAFTTISVRGTTTLTMGKDFVQWQDDFGGIRGRDVTLIIEDHPDGGGNVSEYKILANARLSSAENAADDAIVATTSEGGFGALIAYGV